MTDINRIRWLVPTNPVSRWVWRTTGIVWFVYRNAKGQRRLFVGRVR